MPWHGWLGIVIIAGVEAALVAGSRVAGEWFTPAVWTGYVLAVDGLVARLTGQSYLTTARRDLVLVVLASIGSWWLFELYNAPRFWRGGESLRGLWWQYHALEPNAFLRRVGYDWAFATIFPAIFLTAAALRATAVRRARVRPWRPSPGLLKVVLTVGVVSVVLPLVFVSAWLVPLVWLGWLFLLEPLNYRAGRASWLRDLRQGDGSRLAALLASGAICGFLWEFWNFWATTRWTYTVPCLGHVKLFEMPILGYLGFPPFALECFAMYVALRGWLAPGDPDDPVL